MAKSNKTAVEISLGLDYESSYSAIVEGLKKIISDIEGQSWTTIKLKADVSSFKKSVKEATEAAGGVTKSTETASKSTANLQKKMQDTATATDAVAKGADAASAAVSNVQQSMEGTAAATDAVAKGADTASTAVSGVQLSLGEAASATAGITQGTDAASRSAHVLKDDVDMVAQALEEASQDTSAASEGTSGFREKMEAAAEATRLLKEQISDAKQMLSELVEMNMQSTTDVDMQTRAAQYTELASSPYNPDQDVQQLAKIEEAIKEASKTTEDYRVEFEGLQYQLQSAVSDLQATASAVDQQDPSFQKLINDMGQITSMTFDPTQPVTSINQIKEALSTLSHTTDEYQNAYDKLQTKVLRLAQNNANLTATNKDAAAAVKELQDLAAKGFDWQHPEQSIKELEEALNQCSQRLSQAGIEANTFGGRMKRAFSTQIVQRLTASISTMLMSALKSVYDNVVKIESAMAQLEIVTKATGSELSDVADRIAKSAASIGVSVSALTESVTTYARLGFGMDEAATFAELTAMYSRVAEITVNDATTNLTSVIKAFNVTADELEGVLDELITVGNNFAVSSAELGDALNNAASALAANGNSLEETLGIIAAANATVQDIDKASTAVRTIAARLSNSTAELVELGEDTYDVMATAALAESMRAYNIEIMNADGSLKSTYEILGLIADEWDTLNNTEQAAIAKMVAGTRQQSIFYSIIENWDDATAAVEMCEDATGELASSYEIYLDTMEGRLAQLSAQWESFSENFMQTDFMKTLVEGLTGLLNGLTHVISGFSELHMTTTVIAVAIASLVVWLGQKLVKSFKKASEAAGGFTKELQKIGNSGGSWMAIMSLIGVIYSAIVGLDNQTASLVTSIIVGVGAIVAVIVAAIKTINRSLTKGPMVIITAIAMAIMSIVELVQVINNWETKQERQLKKLKEQTDALVDSWNSITDTLDDYNSKLEEAYEREAELLELQESGDWSIDDQMELDEVEKTINDLKNKIPAIEEEAALAEESAVKSATETFKGLEEATLNYEKSVLGWNSGKRTMTATPVSDLLEAMGLANAGDQRAWPDLTTWDFVDAMLANYDILTDAEREWLWGTIDELEEYGSLLQWYAGEELEDWQKESNAAYLDYMKIYDRATIALSSNPFETVWNSLSMRGPYEEGVKYLNELAEAYQSIGDELTGDVLNAIYTADKDSVLYSEDTKILIDYLVELGLVADTSAESLQALADSLTKLTDAAGATNYKSTYAIMLDEMTDSFNALCDALDDIADIGIVAVDTIQDIMENYSELLDMFQLTDQGYTLAEDWAGLSDMEILEKYVSTYVQYYYDQYEAYQKVYDDAKALLDELEAENKQNTEEWAEAVNDVQEAYENLQNAIYNVELAESAMASELRQREIDYLTGLLEEENDLLDEQLSNYQDLIDMRKELLKTYKEELDYYKELYSRQKKVADLQTQYAVSQLDTSAAGQARQRSLLEQLTEAEEDLNDYTLEHAIDVITAHLDAEYDEYEKYLNKKIAEIVDAINNVGQNLKITFDTDDEGKVYADVSYHEGGFVGGVSTLASNEEFAKLLEGEFVATPQMMERFMKQTMPEAVSAGNMSGNNYYSPLIEINCDSITEDALPSLEKIVDEAAQRLKAELDGGVTRRGYRGSTNLSL